LIQEKDVTCYIQQGLADLDPDVDAIYRLTVAGEDIIFEPGQEVSFIRGLLLSF
jgi:hypothetical protein